MTADRIASLETLMAAASLGIAVFVVIVLAARVRAEGPRLHLLAMIGFFTLQTLDMAHDIAGGPPFFARHPLSGIDAALLPGFIICVWLFVRGLTEADPRLTRRDLIHLGPLALSLALYWPFLALPAPARMGFEMTGELPDMAAAGRIAARIWAAEALYPLWLVLYLAACIRRLRRHRRQILGLFSDLAGKALTWLDWLVGALVLLAGLTLLDELWILATGQTLMTDLSDGAYEMALALAMGVFAVRAAPPLPRWSGEVIDRAGPPPVAAATETPRYARSGLSDADCARIAAKVAAAMSAGQLWRDHFLTLKDLSDSTGVPPIHLSEALNTHLGRNFYDYVNGFRVAEAQERLRDGSDNVLAISEAVGFNSKSTFNAAFKKHTGQTPSAYRAARTAAG